MTEEVMESLPEKLKPHICTLKRASMDTTKKHSNVRKWYRGCKF